METKMGNWGSVLIPLIRKVAPQIIAQELVNVQPMSFSKPSAFLQTREEPFNMYPFIAQRGQALWDLGFPRATLTNMEEFCATTFNRNSWSYSCGNFYFKNEADRTMFVLKFQHEVD